MRKALLLIATFAVATLSFAQTKGTHGETIDAHGIITAAPENAVVKEFNRTGQFLYYNQEEEMIYKVEQSGTIKVAFCEDGTVFFHDLVSRAQFNTWVKGTLADGTITIKTRQPVLYDEVYDATVSIIRYSIDMGIDNMPDDIKFTYRVEDSGREVLSLQDCPDYSHTVGTVWDDDDQVQELGDYASELIYDENYTPSEYDTEVILPDGIKLETYNCYAWSYRNERYMNYEIQLGHSGQDMYITGLYTSEPDAVLKGHRNGNIVTFPKYQYIGLDGRAVPIYAVAVTYGFDEEGTEIFVDADNWTLTFDPATGDYNGNNSVVRFARNPYYAYGNSYESLDEIIISPMPESIGVLAPTTTHSPLPLTHFDLQGRRINGSAKGLHIQGGVKRLAR